MHIQRTDGDNRAAMTFTAYQPNAPSAPRTATETTQNRAESFGLGFSSITTTPQSIGIPRTESWLNPLAESLESSKPQDA